MNQPGDIEDWPDIYTSKLVPDSLLDQCLDLLEKGFDVKTIAQDSGIPYHSLVHALSCRYFDEGNPDMARHLIEDVAVVSRDTRLIIQLIRSVFAAPEDDEPALLAYVRLLAESIALGDDEVRLTPSPEKRNSNKTRIAFLCSWAFSRLFEFSIIPMIRNMDRDLFEIGLLALKNERSPEVPAEFLCHFDFVERLEAGQNNASLTKILRHDIDILFDLNGHLCVDNPTSALMRKPARILVNWFNSPVSSGLSSYDYYLTDQYTVPEWNRHLFTEKIFYLDCGCAATFELPARPIQNAPASEGYSFVFNSFNEVFKLNPLTLQVWAEVLRRAPESALVLKANSLAATHSRKTTHIRRYLIDAAGIEPGRVLITPPRTFEGMLDDYGTADLSLGPIRYNGLTTTINSLWMGVPVICFIGKKAEDRGAGAVLNQVGLQEFMAHSIEDYVEKAVDLARTPNKLFELRKNMRERLDRSAYFNPALFAASFERACNEMMRVYGKTKR